MTPGLVADHNVELHLDAILAVCRSRAWSELWDEMALPLYTFADLGIRIDSADAEVWHRCQERAILLITANRNHHGPDSLEAVIRRDGTIDSLPVLTLADAERVVQDREYAAVVAERLIDICLDVDRVRGTGRLYLPSTTA
jgi:hypothetical protein